MAPNQGNEETQHRRLITQQRNSRKAHCSIQYIHSPRIFFFFFTLSTHIYAKEATLQVPRSKGLCIQSTSTV